MKIRAAIAVLLVLCGNPANAQEPPDPGSRQPILYRKIFVPLEAVRSQEEVSTREDAYIPVERDEFERLVSAARVKHFAPQAELDARIHQAFYQARLDEPGVMTGTAELWIRHLGQEPVLLSLDPMGLAITQAEWVSESADETPDAGADEDAATPASETMEVPANSTVQAQIGIDASGRVVVLVDRSGRLRFDWSLHGQEDVAGDVQFTFHLPARTVNSLDVRLPENRTLFADRAVVTPLARDRETDADRLWRVQFGPEFPVTVVVGAANQQRSKQDSLVTLRQESTFHFAREGTEVTSVLGLGVYRRPLSQIALTLDEGLHLVSATHGATALTWAETGGDSRKRIVLELPDPMSGANQEIVLRAVADGTFGKPWRLPRIDAPDLQWLEGTTTLEIPETLVLDQLQTTECRQTGVSPLAAPQRGEAIQLQDFQARATTQVVLRPQERLPTAQTGTTVELGQASTNLVYIANIDAEGSTDFVLEIDGPASWHIDQVQTQPPTMLEDWKSIRRGNQQRTIQIRLTRPLAAASSLRLVIRAHQIGVRPGKTQTTADLRLGRLQQVDVTRRLMLLAAESPNQLKMTGDTGLSRLPLVELAETDHDLIQALPGGVLFLDDDATEDVVVSLSSNPPSFRADIQIEADVRSREIAREFTIRCSPESSRVDRIQIQFTETLGQQPRWVWLENPEVSLDARKLIVGDAELDAAVQGETWSIALPRPQAKPFRLRAQGTVAFGDESTIPLVSVLGASPQSGSVTLRTAEAVPLEMDAQDVWPLPAPVARPGQFTTVRGVLRYEPSLEGRLVVRRAKREQNTLACVWTYLLESRLYQEGRGIHTARFFLENNGLAEARITVPPDVDLLSLDVDKVHVAVPQAASSRGTLDVALPNAQRFPTITVQYATQTKRLDTMSHVTVPWLGIELSTLHREWRPAVPPGFEIEAGDCGNAPATWPQRLFGPILLSPGQRRFNPVSSQDWWALLVGERNSGWQQVGAWDGRSLGSTHDPAPTTVWDAFEEDAGRTRPDKGWSERCIPLPATGPGSLPSATSVRVMRTDFRTAAAWSFFLLAAGLVGWTARRRPWLGLPMTFVAGLAALYGPATATPFLASSFLGALLSALLRLTRPLPWPELPARPEADTSRVKVVMMHTVTSVLVLLVVLWFSTSLAAAEQESSPLKAHEQPETIHRVLFPIDDQDQPLGPYVYVPREFLALLQRDTARPGTALRRWMIEDAKYQLAFEWDVTQERLAVGEMVAEWRVRTFRNDSRLLLPMSQSQVYLLPDRARLDGEPASVAWEPDGTGLSVNIPRVGLGRLTLALRPRVTSSGGMSSFEIGVPPVPTARARLRIPPDAQHIQCPTALGGSSLDNQLGERLVRLGGAKRLVLQWANDPHFEAGTSGVEADLLTWLRVRPGSVVLNARFDLTCTEGEIRQVELQADPRLRMLPPPDDSPIADYHAHDGDPQRISVTLQPPYGQQVAFETSFIVTGNSGVGVIRPPRLELSADRTRRSWLGLTVDPSLQLDPLPDLGESRVDVSSFVAAWGAADEPPQLALSLSEAPSEFALATRPREPRLDVAQQLSVSCEAKRATLRYQADIAPRDGACFQHRLLVPAAATVHSISITENGDRLPSQWARTQSEEIIVRAKRAITQRHRVVVKAEIPIRLKTPTPLPTIQLAAVGQGAYQVRLYRQPDVTFAEVNASDWDPLNATTRGGYAAGLGRLETALGRSLLSDTVPALEFTAIPNSPRTRGTLLIFLRRADAAWQAEVMYELQIQSGVVDALRFEIPAAWKQPLETDFPARQTIVEIPDQDRQYLVLRPRQAVSTTARFRISGELSSRPGEQVRAPDILPLDVNEVDRYLIAPETMGEKEVIWVTDGLRAVRLPARFQELVQPNEETYLANQPRFQAVIEELKQQSGSASVRLADFHLDVARDGSLTGVAAFDVLPVGRQSCRVVLPESCTLLQASVDGIPAMLKQVARQQWQLRLGPPQLAQQVRFIYQGQSSAEEGPSGTRSLPVPTLVDLPVQQSLWTVQTHDGDGLRLLPEEFLVHAREQELIRFGHNLDLIESATDTLTEIDPLVARSWCLPWIRRMASSRSKLLQWVGQPGGPGIEPNSELAVLDKHYSVLIGELSESDLITTSDLQEFRASRPADAWAAALRRGPTVTRRLSTAGRPRVSAGLTATRTEQRHVRWTVVAIMLIGTGLLSLVLPSPGLERQRSIFAGPALCALGAAWWVWCTPSFLGFVFSVVGISCWVAGWFSRFRRRNPAFHLGTR